MTRVLDHVWYEASIVETFFWPIYSMRIFTLLVAKLFFGISEGWVAQNLESTCRAKSFANCGNYNLLGVPVANTKRMYMRNPG